MNRNVQAFLTLYGLDLPFIEQRDLPSELVDSITLVDTQSMISIKGVGPDTAVTIIDHHPPRENLPAHWSVVREDTGATTTILVDALRERDEGLFRCRPLYYCSEFTKILGSLTYSRTTARDLRRCRSPCWIKAQICALPQISSSPTISSPAGHV